VSDLGFWKPKPIPPGEDWIAPWLRLSLYVSTVGWIVYGVFALAFDDIAVIPPAVQSVLVIIGSALIVMGSEMNTAPTVVAVARKWGRHRAQPLDVIAFAVSLIGSVVAGLIAFSIRQSRLGDIVWRAVALDWGPLIVGIAIACDYYAGGIELGLLESDYEQDMERWKAEERAYNDEHGIKPPQAPLEPARMPDFERVLGRLNGQRATLDADRLADELAADGLGLPSESTVKRWLAVARKGRH